MGCLLDRFGKTFVRRLHELRLLGEELAIKDLLAAARFVLLPQDDLNLACLLKSPLIGLSEDQLFTLAWQRSGHLWRALREREYLVQRRLGNLARKEPAHGPPEADRFVELSIALDSEERCNLREMLVTSTEEDVEKFAVLLGVGGI